MEELEAKLNNEIYNANKIFKVFNIIIIVLIIISLTKFFSSFFEFKISFSFFAYFLIATILAIVEIVYRKRLLKRIKDDIMLEILPDLLEDTKLIYSELGIPKSEFINSGIYKNYTAYYTSDGLKSFSNDIYIANVTAIKKEENRKITIFKGVFGYMKTDEFLDNEIIIQPDVENKYVSNILNSSKKIFGEYNTTVRLENNEFEKCFEVYSKNQIKARQIVTPYYMENLLKIRNKINAPIKIIYKGDKKYVAIWNARIIDEKEIYKAGVKIENLKSRIKELINIFEEC